MSSASPAPRLLVVVNDPGDPAGRLGEWLTGAGAVTDERTIGADTLPDDLSGHAGLVVLGGPQNAYDDDGWLPGVRSLLGRALAEEVPTLGICLGGQLLAVAAGGQVARAGEPEYGLDLVAKRQAAAIDPLFRELPITPDVIQWHVDVISRLPVNAELLASSVTCEVQAFRVGRVAWGTQFHIETTPETIEHWARQDAEALADWDVEALVRRAVAGHDDLAEVWQPFAAGFVAIAADPDSVPRPHRNLLGAGATTAAPITDPAAIRAALAAELQASRGSHQH